MKYRITPAIIASKLEQKIPVRLGLGVRSRQILKNAIIYPTDSKHHPEYIYIDTFQIFINQTALYKGCHVILLNAPKGFDLKDCGLILINTQIPIETLYHIVLEIFSDFYDWIETLRDMEQQETNLNRFLCNAASFLNMELCLSNRDFEMEATTAGFHDAEVALVNFSEVPLVEVCTRLNQNPDFESTFETRGVHFYPSPLNGMHLYYNVYDGDQFLVRLICLFPEQEYTLGNHQLVSYFSTFLDRVYLRMYDSSSMRERNTVFYNTLRKLLNGQYVEQGKIDNMLFAYGWKPEHRYQVYYLISGRKQNNQIFHRYFIGQLEQHIPSSKVAETQDDIVLIRNLSLENDYRTVTEEIKCFLRDNHCKAGISMEEASIEELPILYMQAKDAFYFGSIKDEHYWYFLFENYVIDYLRHNCLKQYRKEFLQHPAWLVLRDYDRQNDTELLPTLKAYIENRFSASAASETLYLHRSTFMHRLERIRQLTNLNFDNTEQRLHLILSCFLD